MLQENLNNENILIRGVISGLLDVLNNKISYGQTRCGEETEEVNVPWYYNQSGDERFMQDFYTNYKFCFNQKCPLKIDGNMDYIPRGVITYNGLSVDSGRLTSRFVEGFYNKEQNGKIETYSSFLFSIPINVKFNAEIYVDSLTDCLKIEQSIIENFFKVVTTYFTYKGTRIGMQIGFPDSITTDKIIQYSYDTSKRINKLTFSVEVETYLPSFDKTTESLYNNRIKSFGLRLYEHDEKNDGIIWFESLKGLDSTLNKNMPLLLEWNYKDEGAIIHKVDLSYIKDGKEYFIEKGMHNNMSYIWKIPSDISLYKNPIVIYENDKSVIIKPDILITPIDGYLTPESFSFINNNRGQFLTSNDEINVTIEYTDVNNKIKEMGGITFEIKDKSISKVKLKSDKIKFHVVEPTIIDIKIYNTVNNKVFDTITNVKVL